ncbi:hypothetical protein [Mesoplasma syrphidae]|nr:hypothetical protein [Mesoplasma syrphidae]
MIIILSISKPVLTSAIASVAVLRAVWISKAQFVYDQNKFKI